MFSTVFRTFIISRMYLSSGLHVLTSIIIVSWSVKSIQSLDCFTCNSVHNLTECKMISQCAANENCFTKVIGQGSNMSFSLGCRSLQNCLAPQTTTHSIPAIVGRSTRDVIVECCAQDYCNKNLCGQLIEATTKQPSICENVTEYYVYDRTRYVRMEHVYLSMLTPSRIVCLSKCGSDVNCISANYQKSTGMCEFSTLPQIAIGSNSIGDSDWMTMSKTNAISEWFLVFLGVAGNGVYIYDAWINGTGVTTDDVNCMQLNFTSCTGLHYRNKAVDAWDNLNIKEVKYSFYKNSQEVAYITFDGVGHSIVTWFSNNGIIASSWKDIQSQTFNYFSIAG